MSDDLPGFSFEGLDKPKVDVLSAQQLGVGEAIKALGAYSREKRQDHRAFEVTPEGAVKTHGYTPDEVEQLLRHYREHMIAFGKGMQALSAAIPNPDEYSPGGYQ